MRVRVMVPTHRRNRDIVVVLRYPAPVGYSSCISSFSVCNSDLMRKILIKKGSILFGEHAACK